MDFEVDYGKDFLEGYVLVERLRVVEGQLLTRFFSKHYQDGKNPEVEVVAQA